MSAWSRCEKCGGSIEGDAGQIEAHILGCGGKPAAAAVEAREPAPTKKEKGAEKELQRQVEGWLAVRDYLRLTAHWCEVLAGPKEGTVRCRGWFGHWFESERNPFMPDLLVVAWPNTRPPLLLELKTRAVYQHGQREAIVIGLWREARSLEEAIKIVEEWEERT